MKLFSLLSKYFHLALGYNWCEKHGRHYGDIFGCLDCGFEEE